MKAIMANFSLGREAWDKFSSKVLRWRKPARGLSLSLDEVREPRLISSDWVKIRTIMSGISDMDEGMVLNSDPAPFGPFLSFPFVPGNENLGIVTDTGEDVEGIEAGERVVINPLLSCESRGIEPLCPSCSRGEPSACRNFAGGVIGPGIMIGACRDTSGGWGDSFIAHKSQVRTIPQNVQSDQAILVPEFTRALRAVLRHPPASGDRVIVVGSGSLGLLTLQAIQFLGLEAEVAVVTEHPFEADLARKFGASDVIVGHGPGTTYEEIAALVDGTVHYPEVGRITLQGGADLVYETTGCRASMEDAISFTGEGKKLVLIGINQPTGFDLTPLWFKGIRIRGTAFSGTESYEGQLTTTFDLAMELVSQYGLPSKDLVTHRFGLQEHIRAFEALFDRSVSKALKVVFQHVV